MATVGTAAIGDILLALQAQLVSATSIDASRVYVTVLRPDEVPFWGAVQDILIRPGSERPDDPIDAGGGRFNLVRSRDVQVVARTRLLLDLSGRDAARLTDPTLGHLALEDAVCTALEQWWPSADTNDALTTPIQCGNLSAPERLHGKGKESGWVHSTWDISISYARTLDAPFAPNIP